MLSPDVFNFYVVDQPASADLHEAFADDTHDAESDSDVSAASVRLTDAMGEFGDWAAEKKLAIAPSKSTVTLFTPDTHQSNLHPQVSIGGTLLSLDKTPTLLGVKLDTHFSFGPYSKDRAAKGRDKVKILKAVSGSKWGASKEVVSQTWKSLGKTTINYGSVIASPNMSETGFNRIQLPQNAAFRIATGCHASTPIPLLHHEMGEMPYKNHAHMLGAQALAKAMRPSDPSHVVVNSERGPRKMKETLKSKYIDDVAPFLENGVLPEHRYKEALKTIHTTAVEKTINELGPNPILGSIPPLVDKSEISLPREQRRVLAQLRTGHCSLLASYQSRIGRSSSSLCPECLFRRQTTVHLFDCPATPTNLSVADLWTHPVEVMDFLFSLSLILFLFQPLINFDTFRSFVFFSLFHSFPNRRR